MALTAEDWPIAAALLSFPPAGAAPRGGGNADWAAVFDEVRDAGFDHVDLTDTWLAYGDLVEPELDRLAGAIAAASLAAPSMSIIRRSVVDAARGNENLAYTHRCIDAAPGLGVGVVSVGLHQALTPEQQGRLWFWTVRGHADPDDDGLRALAVQRFRELGEHAASVGVLLSLEMYEHTFLGTSESAVRLVEEIGLDNVGLNPDLGNIVRLPERIEDWSAAAERMLPYTNFWHVKNYSRDEHPEQGWVTTVPSYLESGVIDYRRLVRMACESGFQGVICTEHYGGDGLSMSAANRRYLRERVLPRRERPVGRSRVRQQFGVTEPAA